MEGHSTASRSPVGLMGKWQARAPETIPMVLPDEQMVCGRHSPGSVPYLGWGSEPKPHVGSGCSPEREWTASAWVSSGVQGQHLQGIIAPQGLLTPATSSQAHGIEQGAGLVHAGPDTLIKACPDTRPGGTHSQMRALITFPHRGRGSEPETTHI